MQQLDIENAKKEAELAKKAIALDDNDELSSDQQQKQLVKS